MAESLSVVVVGAGPAGMGTAWGLGRRRAAADVRAIVVEKRHEIGGMDGSVASDGWIFDYGVHGYFASRPETEGVIADICEICGDDLVTVEKDTSLYFRKRYLGYPLKAKDLFLALNPLVAVLCGVDFVKTRVLRRMGVRGDDATFRGWVTSRYGSKLFGIYFGPYAEKVWGVPAEELSSEELARRVTTISLWEVVTGAVRELIGLARLRRARYDQQPATFVYGKRGSSTLVGHLKRVTEDLGTDYRTGSLVVGLGLDEGTRRVSSVVVRGASGEEERIGCDHLVMTIPIGPYAQLLADAAGEPEDSPVRAAAKGLRYRAMVIVNLKVARPQVFDAQWVYFSGPEFVFNRVNEYKHFWPGLAPEGHTGLGCEITCFAGDDTWNAEDEDLAAAVIRDAVALGAVTGEEVVGWTVSRVPNAYPIFDIWTAENLKAVLDFVATFPNVSVAGRQAEFRYVNTDEAVYSGFAAAETACAAGAGRTPELVETWAGGGGAVVGQEQALRDAAGPASGEDAD